MDKERETAMLVAAKLLAKAPVDGLSREDVNTMYVHGNIAGAFICGVRWADRNPESPWVQINVRMPEDSLPELSNTELRKKDIKAIILFKDGRIMEGHRRISSDGSWYWNIPLRMRDQITHWMPIPAIPTTVDDLK